MRGPPSGFISSLRDSLSRRRFLRLSSSHPSVSLTRCCDGILSILVPSRSNLMRENLRESLRVEKAGVENEKITCEKFKDIFLHSSC